MNRNVLIGIIVTLALVAGGWWYFNKSGAPATSLEVTQLPATNTTSTGETNEISVPGMSKYTDTDFGFSFWYPSSMQVKDAGANYSANSESWYGAKTKILKTILAPEFTIDEVYSPEMSILSSGDAGRTDSNVDRYYFDATARTWVLANATARGVVVTTAADVSNNTMGGLHIFDGSTRFGLKVIIPLSTRNFLAIRSKCIDATDYPCNPAPGWNRFNSAVKTIVATDPSVATPVSAVAQQEVIQNEAIAYGIGITGKMKTYSNAQYGFSIQYPDNLLIASQEMLPIKLQQRGTLLQIGSRDEDGNVSSVDVEVGNQQSDVANCLIAPSGDPEAGISKPLSSGAVSFNGISFLRYETGDVGAGQFAATDVYKTLRNNTCFVITANWSGESPSHFSGAEAAKIQAADEARAARVEAIVRTFRFTSP